MTTTLSDSLTEAYFRHIDRSMFHPYALDMLAVEIELDTRLAGNDREYLMRVLDEVSVGHPGGDDEPELPVIVTDDDDIDDDSPDATDPLPADWTPSPDPGEAGAIYRDRAAINMPCPSCRNQDGGCRDCEFTGTTVRF